MPNQKGRPRETQRAGSIAFVTTVLKLVSATEWRFGRTRNSSEIISFMCSDEILRETHLTRFMTLNRSIRRRDAFGVSDIRDVDFPHAISMAFPDSHSGLAILVLLRGAEESPFSNHERLLCRVLMELGEECLKGSGLPPAHVEGFKNALAQRSAPVMFILDRTYRIVMGPSENLADATARPPDLEWFSDRLPTVLEHEVRKLTHDWAEDQKTVVNASATPLPLVSIRVHSIQGPEASFLAVTVETLRVRQSLRRATEQFTISPREREVLVYLLEGLRIEEIAGQLSITVSTVNDHVKNLISRTHSQNRSQMLARILGWPGQGTEEEA